MENTKTRKSPVVQESPFFQHEPDLIRRAQEGSVPAFERLYRVHVGKVFATCLRMTADTGRAEEFVQESFVKAWEMLPGYRGENVFAAWLHRIAVNTVLMGFRSQRRRNARVTSTDSVEGMEHNSAHPQHESRIDLEAAIAALPDQARMVFVLHDIEGYRHEEIGEIMEIATGTSKAQLHRARNLLKEALRQ